MGLKKDNSSPKPPDPAAVAAAQTGTNIGTAVANANLGFVNQVTDQGSLTYDQTGSYTWKDPETKKEYEIPKFTATSTMSPELRSLYDKGLTTQGNLADIGNQQSGMIKDHLSNPFKFAESEINVPELNGELGDAGSIRRTYGDDFSAERQRVEDALMERINPYLERDQERLRTQMVNQGFTIGDEGYNRGMQDFSRQANDARLGAILGASQEHSRLTGLEAQRAGFENAAQQQQFGQNVASADFGNQIEQAGFGNEVALQGINDQRAIQERNQPLNEISALLSGSQVSTPNFNVASAPQIPTVDLAGMTYDSYNAQQAQANANNQYNQQLMGSVLGLGANFIGA